jgi:hypothetical protein
VATAAFENRVIYALKREDNLSWHLQIFLRSMRSMRSMLYIHISFTSLASRYYLTLLFYFTKNTHAERLLEARASALLFHHTLSAHAYMYMQSQLWELPRFRSLAMQVQEDSAFPQTIRSHVTKNNTFLQNLHQACVVEECSHHAHLVSGLVAGEIAHSPSEKSM